MHSSTHRATALLALTLLAGCANLGSYDADTTTQVDLSKANYRVIKANAIGEDKGFNLLGFIPIVPVTYTDAMVDLYESADIEDGKATATANVSKDRSTLYLILFSLPRLTVRADIIEFIDEK